MPKTFIGPSLKRPFPCLEDSVGTVGGTLACNRPDLFDYALGYQLISKRRDRERAL
jgi:hypothetical protein